MIYGDDHHAEWFDLRCSRQRTWALRHLRKFAKKHGDIQLVGVGISGAMRVIDLADGGRRYPYLLLRSKKDLPRDKLRAPIVGEWKSPNLVFVDDLIDTGGTFKYADQVLVRSRLIHVETDVQCLPPFKDRRWVGMVLTSMQDAPSVEQFEDYVP